MKVSELMQQDVVTAREDASLKDAAASLVEHGISGMPVCSTDGRVVGVVSEADILYKERGSNEPARGTLRRLLGPEDDGREKAHAHTVAEAMTAPAITVDPGVPAASAARLMLERGVNRLPVVAPDGRLLGIVTRADLVRAFVRTDDEIEAEIRTDVLERVLWVDQQAFVVTVDDGEVEIRGELEMPHQVELLERLVERVPGVVSVSAKVGHRAAAEEQGHSARR